MDEERGEARLYREYVSFLVTAHWSGNAIVVIPASGKTAGKTKGFAFWQNNVVM